MSCAQLLERKMRKCTAILITTLVGLASPGFANPPSDISDLIGARGAGAETQMQARGYVDVGGNNTWWNEATGNCVKVHVSQGRYKSIDNMPATRCGQGEPQRSASYTPPGQIPQVALNACMRAADQFQNARPGTSLAGSVQHSGSNWVLMMDTGPQYRSTCTVTNSGRVLSMDPL
ncbi:hypothetical protein ACEUZ9_002741 [Paracoccus litorisediminis]|uniref:Uncharacterized protein n=1 Tax=Paracoccus litorisediminis TaxID=2006130 RepID=A0A844HKU9_9RHOB|nr:hypothetical protein [Paracoccus litorisediminis]MTH60863.1 hypothetical protein [Paracoccus litorisediminis]